MNYKNIDNLSSKVKGLYVILDDQFLKGRNMVDLAYSIVVGGASVIQIRDKKGDKGDILDNVLRIREICESHGALLIVNDHVDLAVASHAHGVHLGQHDLPIDVSRQILLPGQLIGTSNALLNEASESIKMGADYIAVGAIFPTKTKNNTRPAGLTTLSSISNISSVPVVAIGGIDKTNARQVVNAGADSVCVVSAVLGAEDPESAAREIVLAISD